MEAEPDAGLEAILHESYDGLRRFAAVAGPMELPPDDLVHDAIVAVLRGGGFDGIADPVAYVKRAILNLASNERRRLGRRRSAVARLSAGSQDGANDSYPSDLAYLADLEPAGRAVLFLHYIEGESFERIAAMLAKRSSTVRQIATRARRQLREMEREVS